MKSNTTEVIFSSQTPEKQVVIVDEWLRLRKEQPPEFAKVIDE
jgi:hypothetical protein